MADWRRCLAAAWLAGLLCAAAHAMPLVDDRGTAFDGAAPPQRVVTILPSLAEIVCALEACGRLVGVDDFADWPPAVRQLPRVGGVEQQIERIVALKPDLVLLPAGSRTLPRLQALGVPVFGVELKTLADLQRTILNVGRLLGVPGAPALWARIEHGIAGQALPDGARGTSVYVEVSSGPYAAGESSHIGELLARLGASNIVPASLGSVPKLNPEFVVRADPQVIVVVAGIAQPVAQRPGWSRIRAVRAGRVCALGPAQSDVVVRLGPRLPEAAAVLAGCLQPPRPQGAPMGGSGARGRP